jgi:hypothetical protein
MLGIGANTAMFALIHAALLKPLPYKDPGRLVLDVTTFRSNINPWTSTPDYHDYREQADSFEELGATAPNARRAIVTGGERPERVAVMLVSDQLFRTLGVAPVAGRWFADAAGKAGAGYVALVSERFARRRFGAAREALGRALAISLGGCGKRRLDNDRGGDARDVPLSGRRGRVDAATTSPPPIPRRL